MIFKSIMLFIQLFHHILLSFDGQFNGREKSSHFQTLRTKVFVFKHHTLDINTTIRGKNDI